MSEKINGIIKPKRSFKEQVIENALIVVIILMVIYTAFSAKNFISFNNLKNILANVSVRFIIALGISGPLIIRGTDLSAGRIVGITSVVTAIFLQRSDAPGVMYPNIAGSPIIVALLAALAVGLLFGAINGLIISRLNVPPFIATLGTQIAIYGLNMMLSQNAPIGSLNQTFTRFGAQGVKIGGLQIPYLSFVAIVAGIVMYILYRYTVYGKQMYAIGGNEVAAEVSGVNTGKSKLMIYCLAGTLYAVAGFLLTAKTGSSAVTAGTGYELEAIAAATIGGVSTAGGVGRVPGILIGVLVFELLKTCLQFLGITPEMTNVFQGIVIVAAVSLDIRKTMRKK
ncbi:MULTISPECIES: beta-methylgalactoside transporter [unclassified Facklamia]|uniref:ABC transporter permease subunit n=1 Tax=Aerococcaceae TaxID=186827 RepID=UPI0013BCC879|nr:MULTISPECIES: beta-methylgalactoside transporter [unclassified Facklamia]NEW63617.1 beta-methylgalactoside transporter [Facklamia sp. 252]NEW67088.1 beta-methylgalactoside transporter [Facklamia sp. 253]QQD66366.1 beta-methylgalactoside transporter [Aerococcaceae bacterium zg-252]